MVGWYDRKQELKEQEEQKAEKAKTATRIERLIGNSESETVLNRTFEFLK